jgi:hypothetical protein
MRRLRSRGAARLDASAPVTEVGAIDVERALRLVRIAIGIIGTAAVIGARDQAPDGLRGPAAAAAIFGGVLAVNAYTAWTSRRGWRTAAALGGQVLDVAGALGLVLLLDRALDGSSWMLMLLPIVMGGVRLGAGGTLLAWTLGCAGYLALVLGGVVQVSDRPDEAFGVALQRFAFLLAIAVPVAALTQWMQQRWEHQRSLTVAAATRARRLELIEAMARSFVGTTEPRLLANLADAGVQFGFRTVTITMQAGDRSTTVATVGETRWLPTDDVVVRPDPGETLVTHWSGSSELERPDERIGGPRHLRQGHRRARMVDPRRWTTTWPARSACSAPTPASRCALPGCSPSSSAKPTRTASPACSTAEPSTPTSDRLSRSPHGRWRCCCSTSTTSSRSTTGTATSPATRSCGSSPSGLRASIRLPDGPLDGVVARLGGDEFAVVISDAPLERVADVAEHIERSMQDPVAVEDATIPVSFSIGIADAEGAWLPRELISAADERRLPGQVPRPEPHLLVRRAGHRTSGACATRRTPPRARRVAELADDALISLLERSIEPIGSSTDPSTDTPTPTDPTEAQPMNQKLISGTVRVVAFSAAMLLLTMLVVTRSQAAFTATTSNPTSSFTAAELELTDDDAGQRHVHRVRASCPGPACSVHRRHLQRRQDARTGAGLRRQLRAARRPSSTSASRWAPAAPQASCAGFAPSSTLYDGTLAGFTAAHSNWANGRAAFTANATPTTRTFRFTAAVQDTDAAQGLAAQAGFTWETRL